MIHIKLLAPCPAQQRCNSSEPDEEPRSFSPSCCPELPLALPRDLRTCSGSSEGLIVLGLAGVFCGIHYLSIRAREGMGALGEW